MAIKRKVSAVLVLVALITGPNAFAALEVLPSSSHYQGVRTDGDLRIEFAVYDTLGGNEFATAGFAAPGVGRFTYVYQVFNGGDAAVALFQVMGIGQGAVNSPSQIGSVDDNAGGIPTERQYFDAALTKGSWEFADSTLIKAKQSVFLVISSNNDWVSGQYAVQRSVPDFPVPEVPEPATLLLTAVGGLGLLARKRFRS